MTKTVEADIGEFYRGIVEGVPEAVIVSTPQGEIVYFNPASEALLGYKAADVVGKSIAMLVPQQPGRRAEPMKWLTRWAAEPQHTQSRFLDLIGRTKSGHEMPVDVRVVETRIAGEPRFLITFRDNSSRRQEQAAFKEAHLKASRILMIAEDGIVSVDAEQKITFFNLKAEEIFGYRAEDVLGKPLDMLLPARARHEHIEKVQAFGAGKLASRLMSQRGEVVGLRRSGEEFPLEATITKVSVGGNVTYTAHLRDITERKKAQERLRESERRFRAIFDHAFEAIGLLSPDGTVLEINRAGRGLIEGMAKLEGLALWDLPWAGGEFATDDFARQRLKAAIAAAAKGETVRYTVEVGDKDRLRKIDLSLVPVKNEAGNVIYIVPEGRDVTGQAF
ncbi:MAG TPA: PAS domain S-box protein [Parvibaculum sp.]